MRYKVVYPYFFFIDEEGTHFIVEFNSRNAEEIPYDFRYWFPITYLIFDE